MTDLRPDEVTVVEDGVPQHVNQFRFVGGHEQMAAETSAAEADATRSEGPGAPNTLRETNYVSIVLGPMSGQNLAFARQAVLDFFKGNVLPNTLVTIYRQDTRLRLLQPYTHDVALLNRATENATKTQPGHVGSDAATVFTTQNATQVLGATTGPGANPMAQPSLAVNDPTFQRYAGTLDASTPGGAAIQTQSELENRFRFMDSYIGGMTMTDGLSELIRSQARLQGRKVVLYLGDGLALPVGRPELFQRLVSDANRSGVTFYTVDTRGLTIADPMTAANANLNQIGQDRQLAQITQSSGLPDGPGSTSASFDAMAMSDDLDRLAVSNKQLALQELAAKTGGFATANTNDIARPMARVMEDIRTHYEVAYTPKSDLYDGHFRRVQVQLARAKLTVQTRSGYYALPDLNGQPIQRFEMSALNAINTRPAPVAFPYLAEVSKFRPEGSTVQYQVQFEVPLSSFTFEKDAKGDSAHMHASVFAIVQDANGQIVTKVSRELFRDASTADLAKIKNETMEYAEPIELAPGHYTVSTVVSDEKLKRWSVQRRSVYVEPVSGGQLGLSAVEVVKRTAPLQGARNPSDPFEMETQRITPTLADNLPANQPVPLYFVVYPGETAAQTMPKLTVQLFRDGKEVKRSLLDLPKPDATGAIPMVAEMSLQPGSYSLRVTAQQGTQLAQSVRSLTIE